MIDLDQSSDGSTIALAMGETRSLVLGERPTTGFRWYAATSNALTIAVAATEFRLRSLRPGGGGERVFTISALDVGSALVTLVHQRITEAGATVDRRMSLTFEVKRGPA